MAYGVLFYVTRDQGSAILLELVVGAMLLTLLVVARLIFAEQAVRRAYAEADAARRELEQANAKVQHLNTDLERLVTLRTSQLAEVVEQLQSEIAQRKQTEAILQTSESRFRAVWEQAIDAMVISDSEGHILFANPAFHQLTGYNQAEIIGRPFTLIFAQEQRPTLMKTYRALFLGSETTHRVQETIVRADGSHRQIETFSSYLEHDGTRVGMLSVVRDITERKQAEEERLTLERKLLETQKLESLGVLAGGVAHDFNNLLTAILGHADLVRQDVPMMAETRASVDAIITGSQRAAELVSQLLAYAGKGHLVAQPISLNTLVHEMGSLLHVSAMRHANVQYHLAEQLPLVEADAVQIRQVVLNLMVNAAEAIGNTGGTITVTTAVADKREPLPKDLKPGSYAMLMVRDTGIGMDQETMARIFDPFFTTKLTGRGLGLAAVQGIVRRHGGALEVKSVPGQGTTFRIWFPTAEGATLSKHEHPPAKPTLGYQRTVLVVDDDQAVLHVTLRMLRQLGFHVISAGSGVEALELLRVGIPNLACVLLDMTLPLMSGEAVAKDIYSLRPSTPVVLMSGYTAQSIQINGEPTNIVEFLQKPFSLNQLRVALDQALSGS
jgi:PAS domain S-box-containing protein